MNLHPEKTEPDLKLEPELWTGTLKNVDPEKHGMNMQLKNIFGCRQLYFIKTMRNVICCLKVPLLKVSSQNELIPV